MKDGPPSEAIRGNLTRRILGRDVRVFQARAAEQRVSEIDLWAWLKSPSPALAARVLPALRTDPSLRARYEALLDSAGALILPARAAAATRSETGRIVTAEAEIEIRVSRRPDRRYLVIRPRLPDQMPAELRILPPEDEPGRFPDAALVPLSLPQPVDGVIEMALAADDPRLVALLDDRSRPTLILRA